MVRGKYQYHFSNEEEKNELVNFFIQQGVPYYVIKQCIIKKDFSNIRQKDGQDMRPIDFKYLYVDNIKSVSYDNENFLEMNFDKLVSTSGVYRLTFPNNKKYLGQSINIRNRIFTHFGEILYSYEGGAKTKWYNKIKKELALSGGTIEQYNQLKEQVKIEVIYTKNQINLEASLLNRIYLEGDCDNYYNSIYYDSNKKSFKVKR